MRDNWTETSLGAVAEVVGGGTPATSNPAYWDGDIVWLTPTEVVAAPGSVLTDSARKITEAGLKNSGARLLPEGTVILTSRASVGFSALAGVSLATNQGFQSLIPSPQVNNRFLMFWIQNNQQEFNSRAAGSTFKEISKANVKSILLELPPLSEQKRIVDVLTYVDTYIAALQQQAADARTARNAVLHELLTAGREEWTEQAPNVRRFEEMVHLKRGHDLPIQSRKDGEYAVIASNGIVGYHNINEGPVPGVITGRSGTIGKVFYTESGYWPLNTTLYATDFMGNVEPFVALTLEVMQLESFAGGTTVPSLDRKVFRQELVYVPNVNEQTQIVATVSAIDKVVQSTDQAMFDAKKLRSGLLSDLLSGDHEIPESYDYLLGAA